MNGKRGCVHGEGGCVAKGACMVKGACEVKGGMGGKGACMAGGRGHAWQERRPLQWTVRILLECILVSKNKI